jgi:lambda family phage portal protein
MYHAAKGGRLAAGWASSDSTADAELVSSLQRLRGRSRALVRDAAFAKRAKVIVVNNVVGPGIGLQAQVRYPRGKLDGRLNEAIEQAWEAWTRADSCHTGGRLHFADLERLAMGQVFEAGEVFIRKHPVAMGESEVALTLEVIEAERLAEHYSIARSPAGNQVRMGVEVDRFQRPVAYWIHSGHPGDTFAGTSLPDQLVRVPAEQMLHLYVVDRWPQSRGVPWLHAVATRLNDMDGYSEAEIVAARGAAAYMAFLKTPDATPLVGDVTGESGQKQIQLEAGLIEQLPPGYDVVMNNPNRPNPAMDPFMRMMLREVAAGVGVSYESLSRDYSQSNYSSSRLALLDDRDLWRMLQGWFIRAFRCEVHRAWMNAAALSGAIEGLRLDDYGANPLRYQAARFKPRGWSWIDPTKEVQAYKDAVRCGFTTVSDVIAQTGGGQDIEDVLEQREMELEMMEEKDLQFDTDPAADAERAPAAPSRATKPAPADDEVDQAGARVVPIRSAMI